MCLLGSVPNGPVGTSPSLGVLPACVLSCVCTVAQPGCQMVSVEDLLAVLSHLDTTFLASPMSLVLQVLSRDICTAGSCFSIQLPVHSCLVS